MNRKRAILVAVLSTAALSLLAGCGNTKKEANNTDKANADTVKIAVAGPMTGDNSEYGIGFANAAEMKAEEWNEKGGVLGKQIEIVKYDDKNTSEEATTIAQKIVSDGTAAGVIGHFSSGVCMTAAPIYQENKMIEISFGITS